MEQPLFLDFKPHDDLSETLSAGTASLNALHSADISPTNGLSVNSIDSELGQGSKKIRKKRAAYQKIDDDIRLKLLEAVQRGETLKSAAKRYQVNYSSAKSIFHIFRKEGRILKKATTEKGFGFDYPPGQEPQGEFQGGYPQQNYQQNMYPNNYQNYGFQQAVQNLEHRQDNFYHNRPEKSGSSSPLNGLVNNFADLLRISNQAPQGNNEELLRNKNPHMTINPSRFNPSTSPTHAMLKLQQQQQQQQQAQPSTFGQMSELIQMNQMNQQLNQLNQLNQMNQMNMQRSQFNPMAAQQMAQITLASKPNNANMVSPSERMKQFDNFYMNYNNSPLSGNRGMIREGSESGSNRYLQQQNEFDSFSEMVTALQGQAHLAESLAKTEAMAKLQHTPTVQQQHSMEKIEEDAAWNGTLGTAALDTFKSFVDAQMVLNNAFKKASLLNNLVQIQKAKADGSPSPRFLTFQGN